MCFKSERRAPIIFVRLLVLLFCCLSAAALAEERSLSSRPVPEGGGPTEIYVFVVLLDIDEISGANQSFTANVFFRVRWKDSRLAHDGDAPVYIPLSDVWDPGFQLVNQQKIFSSMPKQVLVSPDGEVIFRQRGWGHFSQPFELHDFPFDNQVLEIQLASALYSSNEVKLLVDPQEESIIASQFSLPDWDILSWEVRNIKLSFVTAEGEATDGRNAPDVIALRMELSRHVSYYAYKFFLPLIMIVAMSWIVFWIDPEQAGTQIGVATTSMLTLIAYRFTVGAQLPRVSYQTRIDLFIMFATIIVFLTLLEAVWTSTVFKENPERALRMDRCFRVIFPLIFVVSFVYAFWA